MTGKKYFATDIHCIKEIGQPSWLRDFHWPVSSEAYRKINEKIIQSLDSLYDLLPDDELDLLLSDGFVFSINQFAHASMVERYCRENGYELLVGKFSKDFYQPDWNALAVSFHSQLRGSCLKYLCKSVGKNFFFNPFFPLFPRKASLSRQQAVGVGSNSWLKEEYGRKNDVYIRNTFLPMLAKGFEKQPESRIPGGLHAKLDSFVENLSSLLHQEFQAAIDAKSFLRCWSDRLSFLQSFYTFLRRRKNNLPGTVLVTESARPLHKVIASAWRRQGKRAMGFHHGHFMGEMYLPSSLYNELPSYTDFVLPGSACAASYDENYRKTRVSRKRQVSFSSLESSYFFDLWNRMQRAPFREKISKVMIMGYPMVANRFLDLPGCFFAFQFDLELRLIQFLQAQGFEVYYKIHPENVNPLKEMLTGFNVKIIPEPFEQTWNLADALLVKYSSSTTFAFALCTNKPIFMLDYEKDLWKPLFYELLSRRCTMIPSAFSDKSRIEFDSEFLLARLKAKQEMPDYDYLRRFMFPRDRSLAG